MKQYSKRMVIVHWLTLLILIAAYFLGDSLDEARHEKSATLIGYFVHVIVGGAVLVLVVLRLNFRGMDGTPPPISDTLMDLFAKGIHHVLYALLVLLPVSGFMTLLTSGVGNAMLSGDASLLPLKYTGAGFLPHKLHEILVWVLFAVVIVHILGALKHQFILKDGLMERMSLRRKSR